MKALTRGLALASVCCSLCAWPLAAADDKKVPSVADESEIDGPEAIHGRIEYERQLHGQIDPEQRLHAVAQEYETRRRERLNSREIETVGGTKWVSLGPTNGAGRMTAIAPHPTKVGTVYVGSAGGGVWRTGDGGSTWQPLTEDLPDLSVGALALAPSSPETIYLGTGEPNGNADAIPGIGLLTSSDGGATWVLPSRVIATSFYGISVNQSRAQELVAATPVGGWRSTDGGNTWSQFLQAEHLTAIVRSPTNPDLLYAATLSSQVWKSEDGGLNWTLKSNGLPSGGGRTSLAMNPANPQILYTAFFTAGLSHIYKTMDGGESWADVVSLGADATTIGRGFPGTNSWYNNVLIVSPAGGTVIGGGTTAARSPDGALTWTDLPYSHLDFHAFAYQGATLWIANDGGIYTSPDDGLTVVAHNSSLVTHQYYSLAIDPVHPNRVLAGAQDTGNDLRPDDGGTTWRWVGAGDGFDCAFNQLAPNIAYSSDFGGKIFRSFDGGTTFAQQFGPIKTDSWPFHTVLALTPRAPTTLYTGSERVWRSKDAGDDWAPLSTTVDGSSWNSIPIASIAVAGTDPNVLWVAKGSDVYHSADGGQTWTATSVGVVNLIEADPRDALVAYAALATTSGLSVSRTVDGGAHWDSQSTGLPPFAAIVVRVDPTDSAAIFCGTDVGIFQSLDRGKTWSRFGSGLPAVSVRDLRISDDGSIVRIATHGRGIWELAIPPRSSRPPTATIVAPADSASVPAGAVVEFKSRVVDPADGDQAVGTWTFGDDWDVYVTGGGEESARHWVSQPGRFPVIFTARNADGSSSSYIWINVTEPADDCAHPIVLPGGGPFPETISVDDETAQKQGSDPTPSCLQAGNAAFATVWFEFTPTTSGSYEISTCGAHEDTVISAFTGPRCGPYSPVAGGCNDDVADPSSCSPSASLITVNLEAGQTIRIQLAASDIDTFNYPTSRLGTVPLTVRMALGQVEPRVKWISPRTGSTGGSTLVTLSGTNFAPGASVIVGGQVATDVQVLDSTLITALTPAHAEGIADVAVRNTDGTSAQLLSAFFYVAPFTPSRAAPTLSCRQGSPGCPSSPSPRTIPPRN